MSEVNIIYTQVDRLLNEEHIEFYFETNALMRSAAPGILHADDLISKHTARLGTLDTALQKIVRSQLTKKLQAADKARDNAYRGVVSFNKTMLLHDDQTVREAAERVQTVIDTYGNVLHMNYEKETGAIYNLVQDLKSEKYAPDVESIGLMPWALKLEERNNIFKELLNLRDQETTAAAGIHHIAVKDARRSLDKIYIRFRDRVNSYIDDEDPAPPAVEAFITQFNVIAKRFNILITRRLNAAERKGNAGDAAGGTEGSGAETETETGTEGNEA